MRKKDIYAEVKDEFAKICLAGKKIGLTTSCKTSFDVSDYILDFSADWLKDNINTVKKIFINKPKLCMDYWSEKSQMHSEETNIEDIIFNTENLEIKTKNSTYIFHKLSHGSFYVSKGVGNMYALDMYSHKNNPSKLVLSFHNI